MHTPRARLGIVIVALGLLAGASAGATALGHGDRGSRGAVKAALSGYQEDPLTVSTPGKGKFEAWIDSRDEEIEYRLSYRATEGTVTQAHIHFAGRHQSGRIVVFLCSNLGNGPAGTQACPAAGTVTGTITPEDVLDSTPPTPNQGIAAGEFDELVAAIKAKATYANVHSTLHPGGEIRGQLNPSHHHD